MSNHYKFECSSCETEYSPSPSLIECEICDSPLNIKYLPTHYSGADNTSLEIPLPLNSQSELFSLGEGNTPTVNLTNTSALLDVNLLAKNESQNPTGSFKDRGTSILISCLLKFGIKEIVEDSSGNAGSSISAYSAAAGIKAHIFAPETAPPPKISQIKVYGATHHSTPGSRDKVTESARKYAVKHNLIYASHNLSPYFIEGTKSFGYELLSDTSHTFPTDIVIPVGNGSLYIGVYKAMTELISYKLITQLPRMHFIQAESVKPIASAVYNQKWNNKMVLQTKAGGIAVGSPPRLNQVINIMKVSGGECDTVHEEEITNWQLELARTEGIYCEPTSAAAFAGTSKMIKSGKIRKGSTVLVPITGSGLKDTSPV